MGHIINLISRAYLYGQDTASSDRDFKAAGDGKRRQMWRQRGALGKLHNLVQHVMASGKRTDLFKALQADLNEGIAEGKTWKVATDGGVRWNSAYLMIRRAFQLRPALEAYATSLRSSQDEDDLEAYSQVRLDITDWDD